MFSPGVCWSGLTLNLSGCEVQALQTNSYGEASSEVVGVDEVAQMGAQQVVRLVEVAFDGCVLDGAVHAFDLAVGPRVLGLSQAMIDIVLSAGVFEGVRRDGLSALRAALMSGAAELVLPGVVKWVPLSVRTVWTL